MKATTRQKERRRRSFPFVYDGRKSWFYLCEDGASFHQRGREDEGQEDVFGVPIERLLRALKACGYIALLLLLPVVAEAKMEVGDGPPGNVTAAEIWSDQRAKQKKVITDYDDFLKIISIKEHAEKLRNKAMAENGVLVKLKGEQETIIKIQADQIQACEVIVKQQEQLGATEEQISKAVQVQLLQKMQELAQERRLSRYKSEAFWLGVIAIGLWAVN